MSVTLVIFILILLVTLGITYWAARRTTTASDFYAADSQLTAAQNGFALAGDWCSAVAFLGFSGLTVLYGMDGAFYALGPLVAFCTVLFLIAEPLRNSGKYTLGDVIRSRMQTRSSLLAAITGTIVVNFAYLMPQMAGAGVLVRLLTGISYDWAVIFVGASMIVYVAFGGMLATTWVQIVKAVLMLGAGAVVLVLAFSLVRFNPLAFFADTEAKYGAGYLLPGNYLKNPFDQISLGLGYVRSYTPEMVVDGGVGLVGSRRDEVNAAIERAKREQTTVATLSVSKDAGNVAIQVGAGAGSGRILLIGFDHEHTTKIGRGENGGRMLAETNVVRSVRPIANWLGKPLQLREQFPDGEHVAVVIEAHDGRIVGAARLAGGPT